MATGPGDDELDLNDEISINSGTQPPDPEPESTSDEPDEIDINSVF